MNVITDITSQGHHRDLTRALSEQARTLTYADLPDDVRALARQCVLDYVACTLAGAKEELTDILLAEVAGAGWCADRDGDRPCRRDCRCCRPRWSTAPRRMRSTSTTSTWR